MTTLQSFIQNEILLPRLKRAQVLVVYDPERRYHELCLALSSDKIRVIDASHSSIDSRAQASATLQALGQPHGGPANAVEGMLVYVPVRAPMSDAEKVNDPFSIYGLFSVNASGDDRDGSIFPNPAHDGDEYRSLCLKFKPDHATEIQRIFAQDPNPSFAVIDAVGSGANWPQLQGALGEQSAREILFVLLCPSDQQKATLQAQDAWTSEARNLFQNALGLKLLTRAKGWDKIGDELWRFVLYSEFVFDLPGELPVALAGVPCAPKVAESVITDLCERLRSDNRTQETYIRRAEAIEKELGLADACAHIEDLGERDTFPFEERSFFVRAVKAVKRDDQDTLRKILDRRGQSIWMSRGETRTHWQLLRSAADLIQTCDDMTRQLPDHTGSQHKLIDFYTQSLREADRLQREFEQLVSDGLDARDRLDEVITQARSAYRKLVDQVQAVFIKHLEKSGWPPEGRLANADVFDKIIAPRLQESGRRVALFLIDALRYELGVALTQQLAENVSAELQVAYAQLPSVTPVGMASLLPGAGHELRLARREGKPMPMLGEVALPNVAQRMDVLQRRYGQRFAEATLKAFLERRFALADPVNLLVIRSNEMDADFENNPEAALGNIRRTFQQIIAALPKLRDLGFQEAVIVTDHGFYLNTSVEAGDVCAKPAQGSWVALHERILLGDGAASATSAGDSANAIISAPHLGIRGDFGQVALPRAMIAYQAGVQYFHGGASLQEALVPVISIRLKVAESSNDWQPKVELRYKRGTKRITTRLPVIELTISEGDLYSADTTVDILLQAQDKKGNVVGEANPGGLVNAATRILSVPPGSTVPVTIKMNMGYEGKFTIKALNPVTLKMYDKLELETDYLID